MNIFPLWKRIYWRVFAPFSYERGFYEGLRMETETTHNIRFQLLYAEKHPQDEYDRGFIAGATYVLYIRRIIKYSQNLTYGKFGR